MHSPSPVWEGLYYFEKDFIILRRTLLFANMPHALEDGKFDRQIFLGILPEIVEQFDRFRG